MPGLIAAANLDPMETYSIEEHFRRLAKGHVQGYVNHGTRNPNTVAKTVITLLPRFGGREALEQIFEEIYADVQSVSGLKPPWNLGGRPERFTVIKSALLG